MGRVIAIANQKGGVGKTTTCVNLSACLAQLGRKTLAVDADPQGNTTSGLGVDKDGLEFSVYDLLLGQCYTEDALRPTSVDGLTLLPSNIDLSGAEIELISAERREYVLKGILDNAKYLYDYVIIDCPPSLGILTLNALTAADGIIAPIQCEYYALEGLTQLLRTVELVQKRLNPFLRLDGILFTMFDGRANLSMQVVDEVKKHMPGDVFATIVPRNVRLSEAPSHGLPVTLYDPRSRGAEAYQALALEVLGRKS
ncbi:MAG: AAA family ATPase [Firmicutes bacterium]|nr:AAA family ATPase [Bacillota bacterium]